MEAHYTTWHAAGIAVEQSNTAKVLRGWSWGLTPSGRSFSLRIFGAGAWGFGSVDCGLSPRTRWCTAWTRPLAQQTGLLPAGAPGSAEAAAAGRGLGEVPGGRDSNAGEGGQGTVDKSSAGRPRQARWQQLPLLGSRDRAVELAGRRLKLGAGWAGGPLPRSTHNDGTPVYHMRERFALSPRQDMASFQALHAEGWLCVYAGWALWPWPPHNSLLLPVSPHLCLSRPPFCSQDRAARLPRDQAVRHEHAAALVAVPGAVRRRGGIGGLHGANLCGGHGACGDTARARRGASAKRGGQAPARPSHLHVDAVS